MTPQPFDSFAFFLENLGKRNGPGQNVRKSFTPLRASWLTLFCNAEQKNAEWLLTNFHEKKREGRVKTFKKYVTSMTTGRPMVFSKLLCAFVLALLLHGSECFRLSSLLLHRPVHTAIRQASMSNALTEPARPTPTIPVGGVPRLYVYDHCPFSARVRFILGAKNIKHNLVIFANDDVDSPTKLVRRIDLVLL